MPFTEQANSPNRTVERASRSLGVLSWLRRRFTNETEASYTERLLPYVEISHLKSDQQAELATVIDMQSYKQSRHQIHDRS